MPLSKQDRQTFEDLGNIFKVDGHILLRKIAGKLEKYSDDSALNQGLFNSDLDSIMITARVSIFTGVLSLRNKSATLADEKAFLNQAGEILAELRDKIDRLSPDAQKTLDNFCVHHFGLVAVRGADAVVYNLPDNAFDTAVTFSPLQLLSIITAAQIFAKSKILFDLMEKRYSQDNFKDLSQQEFNRLAPADKIAYEKFKNFCNSMQKTFILGSIPRKWADAIIAKDYGSEREKHVELLKHGFVFPENGVVEKVFGKQIKNDLQKTILLKRYADTDRFFRNLIYKSELLTGKNLRRDITDEFTRHCEVLLNLKPDAIYKLIYPATTETLFEGANLPVSLDEEIAAEALLAGAIGIERYHFPEFNSVVMKKLNGEIDVIPKQDWGYFIRQRLSLPEVRSTLRFKHDQIILTEIPFVPALVRRQASTQPTPYTEIPKDCALALPFKTLNFVAKVYQFSRDAEANKQTDTDWRKTLDMEISKFQKAVERIEAIEPGRRIQITPQFYQETFHIYENSGAEPRIRYLASRLIKPGEDVENLASQAVSEIDEEQVFALAAMLEIATQKMDRLLAKENGAVRIVLFTEPNKPVHVPERSQELGEMALLPSQKQIADDMLCIGDIVRERNIRKIAIDRHFIKHQDNLWYPGKTSGLTTGNLETTQKDVNMLLQFLMELEAGIWALKREGKVNDIVPGPKYKAQKEFEGAAFMEQGLAEFDLLVDPNGEIKLRITQNGKDALVTLKDSVTLRAVRNALQKKQSVLKL